MLLAAQLPVRLQVVLPPAAQQPVVQLLVPQVALQALPLDQLVLRQVRQVLRQVRQVLRQVQQQVLPPQVLQLLLQRQWAQLLQQPSL